MSWDLRKTYGFAGIAAAAMIVLVVRTCGKLLIAFLIKNIQKKIIRKKLKKCG